MTRNLTCIVCPRGCQLTVELGADGAVLSVTGNTCPRGKQYAIDECMKQINGAVATLPAHIGAVVIGNLLGTGANVVVTANKEG